MAGINGINQAQELKTAKTNQEQKQIETQMQQLARISVFLPTLEYGVEKGEIQKADADQFIKDGKMSEGGQTAFEALKQRLQENYEKLVEFFKTNKEVGDNGEEITAAEQATIDNAMADGIVTDEELAEIAGAEEAEEAEEEEPVEEEAPMEEAGKPGRSEEVKAAFDAFMSDLEQGKEFDIKNHMGINEADYKGIVSDFKDDGIVGNGARKEQFKDNTIYEHAAKVGKSITYTDKDGNKQTLKGVHDANDNRTHYFSKDDKSDDNKKKVEEE